MMFVISLLHRKQKDNFFPSNLADQNLPVIDSVEKFFQFQTSFLVLSYKLLK